MNIAVCLLWTCGSILWAAGGSPWLASLWALNAGLWLGIAVAKGKW